MFILEKLFEKAPGNRNLSFCQYLKHHHSAFSLYFGNTKVDHFPLSKRVHVFAVVLIAHFITPLQMRAAHFEDKVPGAFIPLISAAIAFPIHHFGKIILKDVMKWVNKLFSFFAQATSVLVPVIILIVSIALAVKSQTARKGMLDSLKAWGIGNASEIAKMFLMYLMCKGCCCCCCPDYIMDKFVDDDELPYLLAGSCCICKECGKRIGKCAICPGVCCV